MKTYHMLKLAGALLFVQTSVAWAQTETGLPRDVPGKHWAASGVRLMIQTGVMTAPGGVFSGERKVSRAELVTILARLARLLEKHQWPARSPKPLAKTRTTGQWKSRPVTRYEVAAALARSADYAMAGLPEKPAPKPLLSEAIPVKARVGKVTMSRAARRDLQYLVDRRMVWPRSPLLNGGNEPVTGEELAVAVAQMITGVNDILTAEPEDRGELPRPRKR